MLDYSQIYDSFVKGDLEPLYTYMYPALLRYARKLAGEGLEYMAKDCVQEAIFGCYMHRDSYEDFTHLRNALYLGVRNKVIDMMRRVDYDRGYADNVLMSDNVEEDVSLAVIYHDALEVIYRAVDSLPEKYREIFMYSFEEGLKNGEIAQLLQVSEITVKKRKARMLELIRGILGKDLDNYFVIMLLVA